MIRLACHPLHSEPLALGDFFEVEIVRDQPTIQVRAFLAHRPVRYPQPLRDWSADTDRLVIFPESPGRYRLDVEWRVSTGERGRRSAEFEVAPADGASQPIEIEVDGGMLWAPSAFESIVLHDEIVGLLDRLVDQEDVVYDIGANVGFYTHHFARRVGPRGRVVSFEPNPISIQFLRANVLRHGHDQVEIMPVAALDEDGDVELSLNFGNTNLGLVERSTHFAYKVGHRIRVPCHPVDQLIEEADLPDPDLIKIDVEGAEAHVVEGLKATLARARPKLLLELHGQHCLTETLSRLIPLGYVFENPGDWEAGQPIGWRVLRTVGDVVDIVGDTVVQLVATCPSAESRV